MTSDVTHRRLSVELTPRELRDRANESADKIVELREVQARKKAIASEFKAKEEALNARLDELSTVVKTGREFQNVECFWSRNDATKTMELLDPNGVLIETRPFTAEERQMILPEGVTPIAARAKKKTGGEGN